MSESNPKSKRDFDEALSQSVSPLQKKKTKLDDDQNAVVLTDSSSFSSSAGSASGGCSVKSVGEVDEEEEEQSSSICSGCFTSKTNEIATKNPKSVVDLEAPQISEAETSTFITSHLRKERETVNEALGETTDIESSSATEKDDRRKKPAVSKTPTAEEIDGFFSELEDGDKQKRFMEKYNFDIVNDEPLQGRFKWDPIN